MPQHRANPLGNGGWLRQASGAKFAARHCAFIRVHDVDAIGLQLRQIPLRCRMVPHADVHRRNGKHGLIGRQQYGGRKIVGYACRHLG